MKLFNTQTQSVEPITTDDGIFRMYICGVTPYDTTHLGHAFTFVCFDVLARYLEFLGYKTITVQNVTDIDDDILKRAAQLGIQWNELAVRETEKYQADMKALNIRPPDYYPHATQEIEKIQEMVQVLLERDYAYEKNGSVYYSIDHDLSFGKLVEMSYPEMLKIANERGNYPDDPNKDDPLDFVLWQAAQPNEPAWDSPWGLGRPGWHIECSAMSMKYLGTTLDIHAGGSDLIFPHHTCEIAQSEHYSGVVPFVRYWFHIAMVYLDGEKMSKSLGNMLFVQDLLTRHSAEAIRLYLLMHHYREGWHADQAEAELIEAEKTVSIWRNALWLPSGNGEVVDPTLYETGYVEAMNDDLQTKLAIACVTDLAQEVIIGCNNGKDILAAQETLRRLAQPLGFMLEESV